jgi:hypothetical protein
VLCAVAPVLTVLVLGRVIQATGAAMIVPSSLGLLLAAFPRRQHTLAVGIWAGVAAVAASSGAPVGGLLVAVDWRLIFLINVPIGLATVLLGIRVLPEVRARPGARLPDALSAVSLLAAITLVTLAIVQGPSWGWGSATVIGLFVIAAAAAAMTVRRILRHPNALIEAHLFRSREFTAATIVLFLFFVAFSVWLLITVLFLQDEWHYSALRAGLAIAPGPLTAAVFAINSGRIARRLGRTAPAAAGLHAGPAGVRRGLPARPDHRRGRGRPDPGTAVRGGQQPAGRPGHHRQRGPEHVAAARQRRRRRPAGRHPGQPAAALAGAVPAGLDPGGRRGRGGRHGPRAAPVRPGPAAAGGLATPAWAAGRRRPSYRSRTRPSAARRRPGRG